MEQVNLMTEGSVWKKITAFAMPLFWSTLFQQLYNMVDAMAAGRFVGSDALAAVGSTGNLIQLLVGMINGLFVGAGVIVAHYCGAGEEKNLKLAVHTTVMLGLVVGTIAAILGVVFTPTILKWMGTPALVLPQSALYVRIYFGGLLGLTMYNVAAGILQAIGDSKHPLYYLCAASVLHIVLDVLFVAGFGWGVAGTALSTIISEALSAVLGFWRLCRINAVYRVSFREVRFTRGLLGQILQMGIPTGVQNSIISFANVIVQSNINFFGAIAMAGCASYAKLEAIAFLPITSFMMAMTTFISQNLGAGKVDRAKTGALFGVISGPVLSELIGIVIYIFAPQLLSAFTDDPEVIRWGTMQSRTISLFYFMLAFTHCSAGILRGAGKAMVPMTVLIVCWCIIRLSYLEIILHYIPDIRCLFWAYPLTWSLSAVTILIYQLRTDWTRSAP